MTSKPQGVSPGEYLALAQAARLQVRADRPPSVAELIEIIERLSWALEAAVSDRHYLAAELATVLAERQEPGP